VTATKKKTRRGAQCRWLSCTKRLRERGALLWPVRVALLSSLARSLELMKKARTLSTECRARAEEVRARVWLHVVAATFLLRSITPALHPAPFSRPSYARYANYTNTSTGACMSHDSHAVACPLQDALDVFWGLWFSSRLLAASPLFSLDPLQPDFSGPRRTVRRTISQ
jgi:hypothetical protein